MKMLKLDHKSFATIEDPLAIQLKGLADDYLGCRVRDAQIQINSNGTVEIDLRLIMFNPRPDSQRKKARKR